VTSDPSHSPAPRARYFVTGLLTVIPLAVTGFIFVWLVRLLSAIGRVPAAQLKEAVRRWMDLDAAFLSSAWFTDLVSVVVVLVSIYFLGMMMSNFLGRKIVGFFEAVLERIPFVKSVYGAVKKLVSLMRQDSHENVQRVVLIDFPSPEMKTVGLVTRTFRDAVTGRQLAAVYVPTTPNPTSGYLEIVPVDKLTMTSLSFDDAMSMVVSGGAIAPDTIHYDVSWKPPGDAKG
jgi:uncharacterized membrane protein